MWLLLVMRSTSEASLSPYSQVGHVNNYTVAIVFRQLLTRTSNTACINLWMLLLCQQRSFQTTAKSDTAIVISALHDWPKSLVLVFQPSGLAAVLRDHS